ncbi:hypothetical protein Pmar_PMAR017126 [Perkinsus marinus ATCC 50983]|uniref:Uncharacterized protein n=1 Tax=Perkinsus marinus (strain ATCC 50983 / TXsc) TaxID=423536 RepID=C5LSM7_PERM5|nr:hypothetical protein Pmar_PMAR017126 [Perkinsus marinus ATCC 50983]EER00268.1 hypothetical protein Pmar_PMAR017126 [Perkinsus marinus ATCC 50983]|eukprot:XP_002767550.1 hypothetical protein Pmar_PMAR017126 [Perkinsus marinus ATCC 50983]
MAAMARAVTEDLKLLSSRVSGRRDYDHTWGRDNPTCMRLYSAPTSKTALSGSGSAGTAVDGIPGSSIREKPQGGPSNGGSCAYLGRGPDGALVWRYWSPPSHRNVIRPIRSLRTSISSGEIHLLYGNAEVYVFNPHELRFQCITFLPGEEGRLRYKWTSSARTMSALYTTSNPRSASRGIYWSLPLKYDVTRPSIAQAGEMIPPMKRLLSFPGSVIQQSLIPPTRIACSSEVASHCCDGNVVKAAESANSVYWLLSSGIVLHATDRHLLPRVKPEGLVLESMPMTDLARRFSRITEADARTLVNDSVLAPLVRLLRIPYKVRTIAAGWKHALFVLCEEDRVFGIGDSSLGQLGLGDQQLYAAVPTEVSNLRSKAVKNVACVVTGGSWAVVEM